MAYEGVTISQIDQLPDLERSPAETIYLALGCVTCPNKVCLQVDGVDMTNVFTTWGNPSAISLDEAIQDLDHTLLIDQTGISGWVDACEEPCDEAEMIRESAKSINKRFGKSIEIPKGA